MDGARVGSGWSLKCLRTALYGCATRRADAWFELVDALLATERLVSLPHLSLEPVQRRWSFWHPHGVGTATFDVAESCTQALPAPLGGS
jgi:hypothetical protein